jgi:hypothetical protein
VGSVEIAPTFGRDAMKQSIFYAATSALVVCLLLSFRPTNTGRTHAVRITERQADGYAEFAGPWVPLEAYQSNHGETVDWFLLSKYASRESSMERRSQTSRGVRRRCAAA